MGYGYSDQYTLQNDGSWQASSGAGSSSGNGFTQSNYSGSGVYGYAIAGGAVSGTWQENGSAESDYNTATTTTLGSDGAWTQTGTSSSGDGGGQYDSYQGSGNYAIDSTAALENGSGSASGSSSYSDSGSSGNSSTSSSSGAAVDLSVIPTRLGGAQRQWGRVHRGRLCHRVRVRRIGLC